MKKIVYWVGVYTICLTIHECLRAVEQRMDRHEREKRKEVKGIRADSEEGRPMNKIGFSIEAKQ